MMQPNDPPVPAHNTNGVRAEAGKLASGSLNDRDSGRKVPPAESITWAPGLPESALVLLDVDVPDLQSGLLYVRDKIRELMPLSAEALEETACILERHCDSGPEVLSNSVAIVHEKLGASSGQLQILVRFSSPLEISDSEEHPTHYLWILISDAATHPHIDAAAEFAHLMGDTAFYNAALAAKNREELESAYTRALNEEVALVALSPDGLRRTGRLFGGVVGDIKRRWPLYRSDFTDGLSVSAVTATIFLYFSCLSSAVAFGGLLALLTDGKIGVIETILATALCGTIYAFTAAQPLTIIGSTGPVIVFTALLYRLCQALALPFLPAMACIGLWTTIFLCIMAAIDASVWIRYFTRFTDDIFAALVSVWFIAEALSRIITPFGNPKTSQESALFSVVLALGTYAIATNLSRFRRSHYLRRPVREFLADFGPAIAIVFMSVIGSTLSTIDLITIAVPEHFTTTTGRPWLVNPFDTPHWFVAAAAGPAFILSILLFLDQNITTRIVNSPDNKLVKGSGYHLDLVVVALLVGVSSMLGIPWMIAATVRSLNHIRSLARVGGGRNPDRLAKMPPSAVVETRVTAILVHVLIGASLVFVQMLDLIPVAVLLGLFLFMGVTSMSGNQLFERLKLWTMDPERYPPTYYLRAVPKRIVHRFTAVQLSCFCLVGIILTSQYGVLFPLFIALLVPVRLSLRRIYKREHLALLDAHEVPEDEEYREVGV